MLLGITVSILLGMIMKWSVEGTTQSSLLCSDTAMVLFKKGIYRTHGPPTQDICDLSLGDQGEMIIGDDYE